MFFIGGWGPIRYCEGLENVTQSIQKGRGGTSQTCTYSCVLFFCILINNSLFINYNNSQFSHFHFQGQQDFIIGTMLSLTSQSTKWCKYLHNIDLVLFSRTGLEISFLCAVDLLWEVHKTVWSTSIMFETLQWVRKNNGLSSFLGCKEVWPRLISRAMLFFVTFASGCKYEVRIHFEFVEFDNNNQPVNWLDTHGSYNAHKTPIGW